MKSIEETLYELVSVQSDTGTKKECDIAEKIYGILKDETYFKEHPELFGVYEKNDVLKRPVVWALRKGTSSKTIILMGHYDAVEIESYGVLKPYALKPGLLKEKLKKIVITDQDLKKDLESDNWVFGRGIADMKAGLAINLHTLLSNENMNINILFIAVPDEENMSSGALQSIQLYSDLKKKFGLDYKLCLISEPQFRKVDLCDDYMLFSGSMGKILPVVIAKGVLTHSAEIFNGLNSGFIIAEIIRNLELSTDFISEDMGMVTQPPTVQIFKDLKTNYDVSVPEYSTACFNILFLKSKAPLSVIEELKRVCKDSLEFVLKKYNESFDAVLSRGFIKEDKRKNFKAQVLTLAELEYEVKQRKNDFEDLKKEIEKFLEEKIKAHEFTLQAASIYYMKSLLEISGIDYPVVVIGIAPPYYPAVTNKVLNKDISGCLEGLSEYIKDKFSCGAKEYPYFWGMTDMSYMSCINPKEEREFLNNLTLPSSIYDVPVEEIAELNIPSFLIGPASRDVHQMGERVYMPDVKEGIPALFKKIIENL